MLPGIFETCPLYPGKNSALYGAKFRYFSTTILQHLSHAVVVVVVVAVVQLAAIFRAQTYIFEYSLPLPCIRNSFDDTVTVPLYDNLEHSLKT